MKKVDEFEKMEELQGQREQLAVALQVHCALVASPSPRAGRALIVRWPRRIWMPSRSA